MLATANTGEIGRGLEKNAGEWDEIIKEEISLRNLVSLCVTIIPSLPIIDDFIHFDVFCLT